MADDGSLASVLRDVDDYCREILDGTTPLAPLELPIAAAHGCVLAADVSAPWPLPSFDNSAMDGYAVRAQDVAAATAAGPVELTVIDDVPAGFRSVETVSAGQAVRIMTGAPMPDGADAVVPVEATDGGRRVVAVMSPVGSARTCAGRPRTSSRERPS